VDSVTGLTPSAQVSPGPAQLQGSAALVTNAPTSNTAVSFPGTVYSYMTLGANTPTNFNTNTSNIFVEAWIYINDSSTHRFYGRYQQADGGGVATNTISCRVTSTRNFGVTNGTVNVSNATSLSTQTWYHVSFSIETDGTSRVFVNGFGGSSGPITYGYDSAYSTVIGSGFYGQSNLFIRDLRVVQGGVVPVANFTPGAAPFSYASPGYVANMGTTVFTLLGQFITYPPGKYGSAISIMNYPTGTPNTSTKNLRYPLNTTLDPTIGITISFWVYVNILPSSGQFSIPVIILGSTGYLSVNINPTNWSLTYYNGTTYYTTTVSQTLTPGWKHLACIVANGYITAYYNGTQSGTPTAYANPVTLTNEIQLGSNGGYAPTDALYDDLRIYNTALTAAQVQSVYSSQGAPAPSRAMPLPRYAWDFNGTTTDYVSGTTGTTTGMVSYNSSGKYGQSIVITNTAGVNASNYVSYNTGTIFISRGTQALWLKTYTLGTGSQYILNFDSNAGGGISYALSLSSTNQVSIRVGAVGDIITSISTTATLTVGKWHHIAVVMDGSAHTVYIDGILSAGPNPSNTIGLLYANPRIGGSTNLPRVLVNGELDDLRIFDRALTSAQVQSIYNQQGVPGRGAVVSNSRQIYVAPTGTYPSYTPTSGAQFPVFNTSNVSFFSSGGTSGGTAGQYRAFGSQTFNMSSGFSAVCQFAWTNGIGVWERIFDFGIGTANNNILLTRTGTSTKLLFSYSIGATQYAVTATGAISAQNTLYTVVAIYDPSKPLLSLYVNGTLTTSIPAVVARDTRTLTQTYVGRSNWSSDAYSNVNINYLSIYNRVLTPDEITRPLPTPQTTLKGTPLFTQLSPSATSSAVGAFSLRAVNGTTAKAVRVKRASDNTEQDFYADRLGNLLTAPVTGQSLANWLGSSTGNVVTWYDQSGAGRNATGTRSTIVRTSNVNQQWAVNPTNGGLSLSGGTFLNGTDFTITCTTKRLGTQGNDGVYGYGANTSWVSQASVPTTYGNNTRFALVMPNAGSTDVRFNDSSFSAAFSSNANVVPSSFVAATEPTVYTAVTLTNTTQRMYINGTANGAPISTLTQLTANASTWFTIGTVNFYGSFLGEIGELIIFNNALSTSDISTLYSAR
jgi:hypothetical protein